MKKLLIVDDQAQVRKLVEVTLRIGDFEILQAETGLEAVTIALIETPAVIIMDIMMPGGIDGLEACRMIKENPKLADCKIIMLTAKGQDVDRAKGIQMGADAYFSKPFSPLELIKKVEEVMGESPKSEGSLPA